MSFANSSAVPGANAHASSGDALPEITVESLAFKTFNGETKLRLVPEPWPSDRLPSPTSSLLSISSKHGLLAAAGPTSLILARTKAARDAFTGNGKEVAPNIKEFQPALQIQVPRLSQVAFTSDGVHLVICAEEGGGLNIYEVQSLLQDKQEPAFSVPTSNISVRALAPNPAPESAHLVAVVLEDGKLLIANLREKQFIHNSNDSPALKEGVAAISWSNRGKQLTAGMADGNCFQLDQAGTVKSVIPVPPGITAHHVSSLVWLSNEEWLIYHTPNSPQEPDNPPESILHYVQTTKDRTQFNYRRFMNEPVGNFGANRIPVTHYICRLRNWYNIKDWLIMSSPISLDLGMVTNSSSPLNRDTPLTETYATTSFANDSSRISLPMSATEDMTDTTAIGMALDLSSNDKISQPIPGDEMDESPFPLPAIFLLNNEGTLSASWVVYNDALRDGHKCPDLISSEEVGQTTVQSPQPNAFGRALDSPHSASAFGNSFSKSPATAFGQASFGSKPAAPSFGGASAMGGRTSIWGSSGGEATKPAGVAFGQTSMSASKPAFGSTSAFGANSSSPSPFATTSNSTASSGPTSGFGALAGNGVKAAGNPFGQYGSSKASPFTSGSSTQSPFGQQSKPPQSIFGQPSGTTSSNTPATSFGMASQPSFGSTISVDTTSGGSTLAGRSVFGTPAQPGGLFAKPTLTPSETQESDMMDEEDKATTPKIHPPSGTSGLPAEGFKLASTWKADDNDEKSTEDDTPQPETRPKGLFGADFGAGLDDINTERKTASTPPIKEEPAEDKSSSSLFSIPAVKLDESKPSPFGSLAQKKDDAKTTPSLFGSSKPTSAPFSFGKPSSITQSSNPVPPEATSRPVEPSPATTVTSSDDKLSAQVSRDSDPPFAGSEPEAVGIPESDDDDFSDGQVVDDAPLPPDPSTIKVSKDFYNVKLPGIAQAKAQPPAAQFKVPSSAPAPAQQQPNKETFSFGNKISTTPVGFPKATQMFAPPNPAVRDIARSPSPMRSASTPLGRPLSKPPSRPPSVRPQAAPVAAAPPPPPPPGPSLTDSKADHNREILTAPLEPTLQVRDFISHQNYVGDVGQTGMPTQIQRLYRDVNSMIDTLGLNARSVSEFVEGHNILMPDERTKEDLDIDSSDEDEWCIVEVDELMAIESSLGQEVENANIDDKEARVAELYSMRTELVRAKNKARDVKNFIRQAQDEEKREEKKKAPLDKAAESRQRELRAQLADFMKLLAQAEENLSLLKVKLASTTKKSGQVPTVEAVEKTVRKMTQWAEEKGADMDVLEAQMKKLGIAPPSSGANLRDSMRSSTLLRRSAFGTPSPKKAINGSTPRSKGKGPTFSVPEEDTDSEAGFVQVDPAAEIVQEMVQRRRKKTVVMGRFRDAVRRHGVRVTEARN